MLNFLKVPYWKVTAPRLPSSCHIQISVPWPYNGMVNDLIGSIQTKGNYLVAAGLVLYTEICGRMLFFGGDRKAENWKCFDAFLEYMELDELRARRFNSATKRCIFMMLLGTG